MMDLTARDWLSAIGATIFVTVLFCVRLIAGEGGVIGVAFLLMFAIPTALFIFLLVELPLLSWIRRRSRNVAVYILIPLMTVQVISLAPFFVNAGTFFHLRTDGVALIEGGHVRWDNFEHILAYTVEPAMWAGLAGLIYWFFAVKRLSSNLPL
jgi:hypothetical protein